MYHIHSISYCAQAYHLQVYPEAFDGIGCFPGPPYHIQVDPHITPKQTPCRPVPVHLKRTIQARNWQDVPNWYPDACTPSHTLDNSSVLVEGKDKFGKLNPRICLDPTNLNKVVLCEPYYFKTPEDIAHLLADTCVITVRDCKKKLLGSAAWWSLILLDNFQYWTW